MAFIAFLAGLVMGVIAGLLVACLWVMNLSADGRPHGGRHPQEADPHQ